MPSIPLVVAVAQRLREQLSSPLINSQKLLTARAISQQWGVPYEVATQALRLLQREKDQACNQSVSSTEVAPSSTDEQEALALQALLRDFMLKAQAQNRPSSLAQQLLNITQQRLQKFHNTSTTPNL
ncbi:MAG: hypothetical protein ACI4QS_07330 [Comamonas sp.]